MAAEGIIEENSEDKNLTQVPPVDEENTVDVSNEEVPDVTDVVPTDEDTEVVAESEPKPKLGIGGIVKALSKAVADGGISAAQARQMKQDLGIMNSFFTRSQPNQANRKAKRKAAKKARKVNRKKR